MYPTEAVPRAAQWRGAYSAAGLGELPLASDLIQQRALVDACGADGELKGACHKRHESGCSRMRPARAAMDVMPARGSDKRWTAPEVAGP
jgi:hypothetical protein